MEQNRIPKLLLNYKPRGRRDQGLWCTRVSQMKTVKPR
jgi:hypothetical protein